ncbi:MAG TPA: UTP--glucose-1-phosphate uridylyltransferase, partial [Candidatus Omnitrophota bacterium]|nr:UTP--glucose-1-phosphate uridylyltransferase [Candidatus Omnitrophota bacterium]
ELIHDFKELKNLPEAIEYLIASDRQLGAVVRAESSVSNNPDLVDSRFELTEKATSDKYRGLVVEGVTSKANNPVDGRILTAQDWDAEGVVIDLRDENSDAVRALAELGHGIKVGFAYSAGGLSSRGGGIFTARFKFPDDSALAGHGFTDIKVAAARQAQAPVLIMTSFIRMDAVAEALNLNLEALRRQIVEQGYAYYVINNDQPVYIFAQGLQVRIVPQDDALEAYYTQAVAKKADDVEYAAALRRGIDAEKGHAGEMVTKEDGSVIVNPPGHFDFIRYLGISGVLLEAKNQGIRYIFHSNINNPAAHVAEFIVGAFENEVLKARAEGRAEPVSMFLLGENRGEKGGLLAKVMYNDGREVVQLVEGCALTSEAAKLIDAAAKEKRLAEFFPYFNTATFLLNVDALIALFNLEEGLSIEERIARVDALTAMLPVYMDLKEEKDGDRILVGVQLERIYGDITSVAPWVPAIVDRDRHFVPVKEAKDIQDSVKMELLARLLHQAGVIADTRATNEDATSGSMKLYGFNPLGLGMILATVWD